MPSDVVVDGVVGIARQHRGDARQQQARVRPASSGHLADAALEHRPLLIAMVEQLLETRATY
jgi:hypothetical protein